MTTPLWPIEVLSPRNLSLDIEPRSLAAPASVSGVSQVVSSDAGIWKVTYDAVPVFDEQRIKAWRAIANLLEGRLGSILVPITRFYQPVPKGAELLYEPVPHSDDAFFDDDTGYVGRVIDVVTVGSMALRAVSGTVAVNYAGQIEPGQHFSVGERLYRVRSYNETVPATPAGTVTAEGDFAGAAYDPAKVSLSRESPGSYFDASGVLRWAEPNELRIDHLGALIEGSATNLILWSEDFNNAAWPKGRASVIANAAMAPNGAQAMDKLVDNTETNTHLIVQQRTVPSTSARHTFSFFAKAGEHSRIVVQLDAGTASWGQVHFDLANGTVPQVSGNGTGSIEHVGGGIYRCCASAAPPTASTIVRAIIYLHNGASTTFKGDGSSGVYFWGAQLEVGTVATSYIKTESAQATRAPDALTLQAANVNNWMLTLDDGSAQGFDGISGNLALTADMLGRAHIKSYRAALARGLPATGAITFRPPLREAVPSGTNLEFDDPVCRMRLATDSEMDLPLDLGRFSFPSVQFIEDL